MKNTKIILILVVLIAIVAGAFAFMLSRKAESPAAAIPEAKPLTPAESAAVLKQLASTTVQAEDPAFVKEQQEILKSLQAPQPATTSSKSGSSPSSPPPTPEEDQKILESLRAK